MIYVDERLTEASPLLRKKVEECRRVARDVKMQLLYKDFRLQGESYCTSVRRLSRRFSTSVSTVKRALRGSTPPWKKAAGDRREAAAKE